MSDIAALASQPRSRLALGTLGFGTTQNRDASFALLDAFIEEGGRLIDSAHVYGNWDRSVPPSASERMVGAWMSSRGVSGDVSATTKIGHPSLDDPGATRLDPELLRLDIEEARDNFGLETIPLVYLHRDSTAIPVEELLAPLEAFTREGLIAAYGASNWTTPRLKESREIAADRGWAGFTVNQPCWGLARRLERALPGGMVAMDEAMHRFHEQSALPVSPYSSQSRGYFSRWRRGGADTAVRDFDDEHNRAIALHLDELAPSYGLPATELSVAVLLASSFPVMPVIGTGTVDQLRSSFRATSVQVSTVDLEAVRALSGFPVVQRHGD
ncbi:aldo/keto reductase [Pseudoclavibacter sp. RFBA6]|uniref:aldo/keto reductase n=1 Tax=Pseudoclavibacter sp. RFBA6 TaxID=2080573 RepID=UPI0015E255F5|nr:aldo/keto reductase [Pseudoclavibacter sp. RFBA6]